MRGTKIGILTLAAAGLVLTGCSSGGDGTTTTPSSGSGSTAPDDSASPGAGGGEASDDLVGWVANLCTAIGSFEERFAGIQTLQPTDPADLSGYLVQVQQTFGEMGDLFADAYDAIEDSGPPPIEDGEDVQAELLAALDSAGQAFEEVGDQIATIDPNATDAMVQIQAVYTGLLPQMEGSMTTLDAVFTQPDMEAAFAAAPECEGISGT